MRMRRGHLTEYMQPQGRSRSPFASAAAAGIEGVSSSSPRGAGARRWQRSGEEWEGRNEREEPKKKMANELWTGLKYHVELYE